MQSHAFKIRRSDGLWYRSRAPDGALEWTDDVQSAARFDSYVEALGVAQQLGQAGIDVKLVGVV